MQKIKYKFVETTGCTAFDFTVNDKSLSDIPQNDQDEILEYLLLKIKDGIKDNTIQLENVVQMFQYDDYEHDDHVCGQCGDTVSTTTWNI
jgi:hypothetical protein